jgi:hypothetical protein
MEHSLYTEVQVLLPVVIQERFTLYWKCWREGVGYMLVVGSTVGSELSVGQDVGLLSCSAFMCCYFGL